MLFPVKGSDTSTLDTAVEIIRNRVDGLGIAEPDVQRQGNTIVVDLPGAKTRSGGRADRPDRRAAVPAGGPDSRAAPLVPTTTTTTKPGATTTTEPGATTTAPSDAAPRPRTTTKGSGAGARTMPTTPIAAVRPAQATPTTTAPHDAPTTCGARPRPPRPPTRPRSRARRARTCHAVRRERRERDRDPARPHTELRQPGRVLPARSDHAHRPQRLVRVDAVRHRTAASDVTVTFKGNDFVDKVAAPYVNKQVAIELDGVVQSAPKINPGITGKQVQITGNFSQGEAKDLALVLKYGALPVQFDQTSRRSRASRRRSARTSCTRASSPASSASSSSRSTCSSFYRLLGLVVVGRARAHRPGLLHAHVVPVGESRVSRSRSRASPASSCRSVSPSTRMSSISND